LEGVEADDDVELAVLVGQELQVADDVRTVVRSDCA
jgi:hypothetical protein